MRREAAMDVQLQAKQRKSRPGRVGAWFRKLGPGLVTGAADDDPSGIATYSQAGARFGYDVLWSIVLTYPLMVAVQMISARIGAASGQGLASNMREHSSRLLVYPMVALLCIANVINIAADVSAMGAAGSLLGAGSSHLCAVVLGLVSLLLQIFVSYERYVAYLKWLTLVLLAYVATVFLENIDWTTVAMRTLLPHLQWKPEFITVVVAILGTTISPYLFFWQASQEVEQQHSRPGWTALRDMPERAGAGLRRIKLDTLVGMGVSNCIAFFIILSASTTFHAHGMLNIESSAQAAAALRPLVGDAASALFSLGIIGTGLLALPVLAGSAAYGVCGALQWRSGLGLPLGEARAFYGVIALCTVAGIALSFSPIDPMKALFWSAVINGVVAVPAMVVLMLLATKRQVMGALCLGPLLTGMGWLATAIMGGAAVAMLVLQVS
jgi:NRAMP (natural resistance-associated macrophage protein)-like metal ion transporter